MHIINLINNNDESGWDAKKNSKFTVVFQDKKKCKAVAEEIELLTSDDRIKVWDAFKGQQAQKLLSNVLDGLIVFLSCKQDQNTLLGEYFSIDSKKDNSLFTQYIHEVQKDAQVEIGSSSMAV